MITVTKQNYVKYSRERERERKKRGTEM